MIDGTYYDDEDETNNGKDKVTAVTPENADDLMSYINNLNR